MLLLKTCINLDISITCSFLNLSLKITLQSSAGNFVLPYSITVSPIIFPPYTLVRSAHVLRFFIVGPSYKVIIISTPLVSKFLNSSFLFFIFTDHFLTVIVQGALAVLKPSLLSSQYLLQRLPDPAINSCCFSAWGS